MIAILVPATALAEMAMIASIVPLLASLSGTAPGTAGLFDPLVRVMPVEGPVAAAVLFVFSAVLANGLRLWLARASHRFSADLGHELTMEVHRRMLHQPYLFHVAGHSSRLIASLEKVDQLVLGFALRGIQAMGSALIGLAIITALLLIDPLSASVAILLVAILYGAALLAMRRRFHRDSEQLASAHERRIHVVQENISGIRDIIIDQSQATQLKLLSASDRAYVDARASISFLGIAPRYVVEAVGLALVALIVILFADRPGGLAASIPLLGALALGAQRLLPLTGQFYGAWVALIAARPVIREVASLMQLPVEERDRPAHRFSFKKAITFGAVGFHYPDRPAPALRDIDVAIPRGSRTAIVGPSGSGKSTFADLLMGLMEPTEGQIRVDGSLIVGAAMADWRHSVAHVPQSIFLADTTIAKNIASGLPSEPVEEAEILRAAKIAQLDEFVKSLPQGYETGVGERGVRLSGGQRQRLAIARAVYKRAPLLVLDEATSALDEPTESAVLKALDELQKEGCTIVIVAHRLSTIQSCDHILMLEHGRVIQAGTFPELFGRLNRLQEQGAL